MRFDGNCTALVELDHVERPVVRRLRQVHFSRCSCVGILIQALPSDEPKPEQEASGRLRNVPVLFATANCTKN